MILPIMESTEKSESSYYSLSYWDTCPSYSSCCSYEKCSGTIYYNKMKYFLSYLLHKFMNFNVFKNYFKNS